ncbi:MAG: chemotaxis protein CheW [Bacteroidales bacterium]|nr:chemotaxis protein CheW [Bacteroidales bacterium]
MGIAEISTIKSYLTFKIGDEEYGAHVNKVQSILGLQEITKVPKSPDYMKGVINLREMVLPIIDTRVKFDMTPTEFTDNTSIIVIELGVNDKTVNIGALVDSVVAVREIDEKIIQPSPRIGNNYKFEFISGVVKLEENFIMILDLVKLFTSDEFNKLKKIQTEKSE